MLSGERIEVAESLSERGTVGTGDEIALDDHAASFVGVLDIGGYLVLLGLIVHRGDYRLADAVCERARR